jgi:hypothetical protein
MRPVPLKTDQLLELRHRRQSAFAIAPLAASAIERTCAEAARALHVRYQAS